MHKKFACDAATLLPILDAWKVCYHPLEVILFLILLVSLLIVPGRCFFPTSFSDIVVPLLVVGVRPAFEPAGVVDAGVSIRVSRAKIPFCSSGLGCSVAAGVGISEDCTTWASLDGRGPSLGGDPDNLVSFVLDAMAGREERDS